MKASVFNIQKFCTHDGPGIRTTVFFSGCPLRCKWCHNPEGKTASGQLLYHSERCISCGACASFGCGAHRFQPHTLERSLCQKCGRCAEVCPAEALEFVPRSMDTADIIREVLRDAAFYGENGGITLSGGEPLMQPKAAAELLRLAKENGLNTAVETSGCFGKELLKEIVPLTDTFLWDFKDSDPQRLMENTGLDLEKNLENIRMADRMGGKIRLRCILLHGINTTAKHANAVHRLRDSLKNCTGVDIIPYHPMGKSKYGQLGIENTFDSEVYIPTEEDKAMFR